MSYTYDANGNMTHDGMRGVDLEYNSLNLVSKVKQGNTANATYRWLADGTKAGVTDNEGNGFEYLGSFVYQRDVNGLNLESTSFGAGRFVASSTGEMTPYYHITDHLGSVRVVYDSPNAVLAHNDYYAFGLKHENPNLANHTANRYLFNGKEEQTTGNVDLLDYGARMYDATLGRWHSVDPLAEKYLGTSTYAFSGNNPIKFVDPNGMWYDDYYSRLNGKYLGSDGAATNNMRLINDDTFNRLSRHLNDPFMNRDLAVASLQGASDIISVDEEQIQSSLQSVADNSRSSGVEHSIIIVLDRATATISAVEGPEGENRFAPISYHPGPVTGVSFYERAGGPIIIGQAHGHPANSDPNLTTQKTMSDDYDVNVATNMQIPVYGIDAMDGKQGSPANIHMVYPNGIIRNNIGNTQTIGIGRQAMTIWGFSNKPR